MLANSLGNRNGSPAPYVLMPQPAVEAFLQEALRATAALYPDGLRSTDYTSIVDEHHYH